MKDFNFKTEPFEHQLKAFDLCKNKDIFALFMEQGTGKTKVAIDKSCYQYCNGKINAVLIVAPNGVHSNWIINELPKHIPTYIHYNAVLWKKSKTFQKKFEDMLYSPDSLSFFAINYEALATEEGKKYVRRYIDCKDVLMILDESSRIKTPNAKRTKATINFGRLVKEKLILTGTPVTQGPFDLYAQFKFLDLEILGNQTYTAFKHEYGVFENKRNGAGYEFQKLVQYKNLDKLKELIDKYSFRVTKEECLDLPEKIYQKYSIELTPQQRKHYDELKNFLITEIANNEIVTPHILTNLLRLQQITGGHLPTDKGDSIKIGENNPKLDLMLELLEDIHTKVIIWARFIPEIELIVKTLSGLYGNKSVVEYWGGVVSKKRDEAVYLFQNDPQCRFFVGNPKAAGLGLTLTEAKTIIYFSNDFSLESRLQSEDRAHRIGQKDHVTYIDIEAIETIDEHIILALREKKNLADLITGDTIRTWL